MDVEAALKLPEFTWIRKKITEIDEILAKKDRIRLLHKEKTPEEKRKARAERIIPIIASIKIYMESNRPWKDMEKAKLVASINSINNYVYKKVWEGWRDEELREKDEKACKHIQDISFVTGPENFGLPEDLKDEPLIEGAIKDIKSLDGGASPDKKLEAIYEACNKFSSKKRLKHIHTYFYLFQFQLFLIL